MTVLGSSYGASVGSSEGSKYGKFDGPIYGNPQEWEYRMYNVVEEGYFFVVIY